MEGLEPTVGAALTEGNGKALSGCELLTDYPYELTPVPVTRGVTA